MRIQHLSAALILVFLAAGDAAAQQAGPSAPPPNGAATAGPAAGTAPSPLPGAQIFQANCQSCHGTNLQGGRGPSLFTESLLAGHSDDQLRQIIKTGVPNSEMPSFTGRLTDEEMGLVIAYLRIQGGRLKAAPPFTPDPNNKVIQSQKQTFRIEVVAAGMDTPWGEAFMPDGRMLVTQRSG